MERVQAENIHNGCTSTMSSCRASVHPPVGVELLLLPKYSPDLNPIEHDLVKLEHSLRDAAASALDGVSQLPEAYTPQQCGRYRGLEPRGMCPLRVAPPAMASWSRQRQAS
jgi:hypothetical protein